MVILEIVRKKITGWSGVNCENLTPSTQNSLRGILASYNAPLKYPTRQCTILWYGMHWDVYPQPTQNSMYLMPVLPLVVRTRSTGKSSQVYTSSSNIAVSAMLVKLLPVKLSDVEMAIDF